MVTLFDENFTNKSCKTWMHNVVVASKERDAGAKPSTTATAAATPGHIMISYQWGNKPTMLRVRDNLKAAGFNVWMDVDNMCNSNFYKYFKT